MGKKGNIDIKYHDKEKTFEFAASKQEIKKIIQKFKDPTIKKTKKYIIVEKALVDYAKIETKGTGIGIYTPDMKIVKRCKKTK